MEIVAAVVVVVGVAVVGVGVGGRPHTSLKRKIFPEKIF